MERPHTYPHDKILTMYLERDDKYGTRGRYKVASIAARFGCTPELVSTIARHAGYKRNTNGMFVADNRRTTSGVPINNRDGNE